LVLDSDRRLRRPRYFRGAKGDIGCGFNE